MILRLCVIECRKYEAIMFIKPQSSRKSFATDIIIHLLESELLFRLSINLQQSSRLRSVPLFLM